ncbi:MAG: RRXRR domain-containing protein [Phormidesmis sp.]
MRIPVVDSGDKPLMPTQPSRARKWLEQGKAVKRWSDTGLFYVQLVEAPSGTKTQPVVVGVDPGKLYSGIGVQSAKATLFMAHLVLPFETVKQRMAQRAMMRRTRRARRINREVPFAERNHREQRFDNRIARKVPPSIKANRQLELRVVSELCRILPVTKIVYEYVKARGNQGFSPVMVGQRWAIEQLETLASVVTQLGWKTANIRRHLGIEKASHKAEQSPAAHAMDGVALAASEFVQYRQFHRRGADGGDWVGAVEMTAAVFRVIRRPSICRRQLHLLQFAKGGKRRNYGGTVTRHGFRKGDLVSAIKAGVEQIGWVSGDTAKQVSVSDINWKRLGQFTAAKVRLIKRSTGLLASGASSPTQPALIPHPAKNGGLSGKTR